MVFRALFIKTNIGYCFQRRKCNLSLHLFCLFPLCFLALKSFSQPAISIPVALIDHEHGLNNVRNYYCYKDSKGIVWISSYSGFYRYDGKALKIYLPSDEDPTAIGGKHIYSDIFEDQNSDLWFCTFRNISKFQRQSDNFVNYSLPNTHARYNFHAFALDQNNQLWFTHYDSIYTLNTLSERFLQQARIPPKIKQSKLIMDEKSHRSYVLSYSENQPGLFINSFEKGKHIGIDSIFTANDSKTAVVFDVYFSNGSTAFLATDHALYSYDLNAKALKSFSPRGESDYSAILALTSFNDSLLFVGTSAYDFYAFNINNGTFETRYQITHKGDILSDLPRTLKKDREGGIWIYLHKKGVAYFHPTNLKFSHYPHDPNNKSSQMPSNIRSIIEYDSNEIMVFSYLNGVHILHVNDKNEIISSRPCLNCPARISRAFKDSRQKVWMYHGGRVSVMGEAGKVQQLPKLKNDIYSVHFCELNDHRILFASRKGNLFITDNDTTIDYSVLKPANDSVIYEFAMQHENGLLYVSSNLSEIFAFDPDRQFKPVDTIPFKYQINCFQSVENSDDFILGSNRGAYYYNAKQGKLNLIDYANHNYHHVVNALLPIGDQQFLIAGNNGACIIDIAQKKSFDFGIEHGLGMTIFNRWAFLGHSNGSIWLGNTSGITACPKSFMAPPVLPVTINITSIEVNDKPYKMDFDDNPLLSLHYSLNTVSFRFAALNYADVNGHDYEYRMTGLEKEWVDGGKLGFARYVNLPFGKYSFEARVKGRQDSIRRVAINIRPPLYSRMWFQNLVGLSAFLLVYLIGHNYLRRKQRLQRLEYERRLELEMERVRIATDMHDEVGSGLSALNMRAQMLANQVHDSGLKLQLKQLANNSRQLTQKIREIIWTVNAQNDTIENLVTGMHQYAKEYFEETKIKCSFLLLGEQDTSPIAGDHRREIYLAFKEALHNVFKHANATQVNITMETTDKILLVEIKDNGVGFEATDANLPGNGLNSMRQRMSRINGVFEISSSKVGTAVHFEYPYF